MAKEKKKYEDEKAIKGKNMPEGRKKQTRTSENQGGGGGSKGGGGGQKKGGPKTGR